MGNTIIEVSMNSYQSMREQNQNTLRYQKGIYPQNFISCVKSNDGKKGNLIKVTTLISDFPPVILVIRVNARPVLVQPCVRC